MTPNRANLDDLGRNSTYVVLTVVLVILSIVGLVLFFQLQKTQPLPKSDSKIPVSGISPPPNPTLSPTVLLPTPTTPKTIPTVTVTPGVTVTPTPATLTFKSDVDKFTAIYKSSRKLYQNQESGGTRYTFYSPQGNIALHVGTNWSWVYPDRQFSQSLLVSGYSTFIYDIDTQTIVDFKVGDQLFTIQCVHSGDTVLKTECRQFLVDFKTN